MYVSALYSIYICNTVHPARQASASLGRDEAVRREKLSAESAIGTVDHLQQLRSMMSEHTLPISMRVAPRLIVRQIHYPARLNGQCPLARAERFPRPAPITAPLSA
jgi:hypothetical protein